MLKSSSPDSEEVSGNVGSSFLLHESESLKLFPDHLKSIWTLSAGGLPLVVAFLGYATQNLVFTGTIRLLLPIICLVALVSFFVSIHTGILAQKLLITVLLASEERSQKAKLRKANETASHSGTSEEAGELKRTMTLYKWERRSFLVGAYLLLGAAFSFLTFGVGAGKQQSREVTVALKNVGLTTENSAVFKLEDASFRIVLPKTVEGSEAIEVRDVNLKIKSVSSGTDIPDQHEPPRSTNSEPK